MTPRSSSHPLTRGSIARCPHLRHLALQLQYLCSSKSCTRVHHLCVFAPSLHRYTKSSFCALSSSRFSSRTPSALFSDPARRPKRWSLPRQTWIDVCTASTSVLHHDLPQEPAKEQSGAAAADRTPTPKSVTEPPNTKSNTQELSRNREPVLSHSIPKKLASVKKTI